MSVRCRAANPGCSRLSRRLFFLRLRRRNFKFRFQELPVRQFVHPKLTGRRSRYILNFLRPQRRNLHIESGNRRIVRLSRTGRQPHPHPQIADIRLGVVHHHKFHFQLPAAGLRQPKPHQLDILRERMLLSRNRRSRLHRPSFLSVLRIRSRRTGTPRQRNHQASNNNPHQSSLTI
jgi:hypothetical protein